MRRSGKTAMCFAAFVAVASVLGCSRGQADPPSPAGESAADLKASLPTSADENLPPDLGTREGGEDWPRFLGANVDSRSTELGATDWPPQGPKILWAKTIETTYAMPAISRGRMFRFERRGNTNQLVCEKSESGEGIWSFEYSTDYEDMYGYDGGPRCSPVVDGARVYAYGPEGVLHCVSAIDGKLRWKVDTFREFSVQQNFFGVGSTPFVEGDLLLVHVGGGDAPTGNGSAVVAFNKFTGDVVWKSGDDLASYASPLVTEIHGSRMGLQFARGGLFAFDPANGKEMFHFPWRAPILESVNASNPVVVDDCVFISESYGPGGVMLKIAGDVPKVVWSDSERRRGKSLETHWNTPIHHAGYLYGSSGRHTNEAELRCVELTSGMVMWSEPGLSRASLLYADGRFVALTEYGELIQFRATPEKFDVIARFKPEQNGQTLLNYPAWAAPILSHGLLYVQGARRLVCFEWFQPRAIDQNEAVAKEDTGAN